MLAHADEIARLPGLRGAKSVGEKVKEHVEAVRLSRKLVALDENVTDAGRRSRRCGGASRTWRKVETLFRELEFVRLLDRLKPIGHKPPTFDVERRASDRAGERR